MHWFLKLMEELKIECRVGHPAKIRAAEPRKQKHDRRDALLLLNLLAEDRFPSIWMPSTEQRDRAHCCVTVISGYGCGLECRTRCKPWPSVMVCGAVLPCGAKQANTLFRCCR